MDNYNFSEEYRKFLKDHLQAAQDASGNTEVCARCMYCPDSRDPTHGHMYISIPRSEDELSVYYCHKCKAFGAVTNRTLIEWGIYDPIIGSELNGIYKNAQAKGKTVGFDRVVYQVVNTVSNMKLAQTKLEYINQRIGTSLTIEDALNSKIVLNLQDLLRGNQITQYTRHQNIITQLNNQFVGFLSMDNNFVNLRRICEEGVVYSGIDKRYINYNIFGKKDNTEKFYTLPVSIRTDLPRRIPVHIAEGPFDILSVRYNLRRDPEAIYCAIGGSGYKGLLRHLITTMNLFYIELHLYPDNDEYGSGYVMSEIKQYLQPYQIPIYVHYNQYPGEKDMGVPTSRINEVIMKL